MRRNRAQHVCLRAAGRRAGLAPLELVLSLPLLLFVMGLMIIFGTAAAWKVRTQANSRQVVWRTFTPRTGANDPRPRNWPATAEFRVEEAQPSLFETDPFAGFEIVRGPIVVDHQTGASLPVDADVLDLAAGLKEGFARIERPFVVMNRMPPREIDFARHHQALDETRWQYWSMGLPSNIVRRIPRLYPMRLDSVVPELTQEFTMRALEVYLNPNEQDLTPLEGGDPEVYELIGRRSPDFQQRIFVGQERATIPALAGVRLVPLACQADPLRVHEDHVVGLLQNVRAVPGRMTDYYIGVYQRVINRLQNTNPPPPGAAALIAELQQKIEQLQRFQPTLP